MSMVRFKTNYYGFRGPGPGDRNQPDFGSPIFTSGSKRAFGAALPRGFGDAASDRLIGIGALQQFYADSPLASQGVSPDQMIAYYDANSPYQSEGAPGFIARFGSAIRVGNVSSATVATAMNALANAAFSQSSGTSQILFPAYADFFNALAGEVSAFHLSDVSSVIAADAGAVTKTAGALAGGIFSTRTLVIAGVSVAALLALYIYVYGRATHPHAAATPSVPAA